ncbi:MAG: 2-succinyl-5-enolpyruvyl-6-hydroxy-3-cyclohexene-1-carboxylic-acid synthase [Draconibacterium sp.]
MYTVLKNYQIIIALLKKYGIQHLVLSAGTRNVPFVHSVENDPDFTCYSVVDERSAAYFAMGIAQEVNAPVAISCTSSTATTNYLPAITEAFHLKVPLLVITSDRNPYYLGQLEDQMIDQVGMYGKFVRKSVTLPFVSDEEDFWYCERLANEALLELSHRGKGPVHINIPTFKDLNSFSASNLPDVRKINRIEIENTSEVWMEKVRILERFNKILVICGQTDYSSEELKNNIELFTEKFNCTVAIDHMSNLYSNKFVEPSLITHSMSGNDFDDVLPDLVITFGENYISQFKGPLKANYKKNEHWLINENGEVVDMFKSLSTIFECSPNYFFKFFNEHSKTKNNNNYNNSWKMKIDDRKEKEVPFSNVLAIKEFSHLIPDHSILHLSILNSIRITSFFKLSPDVKVYANLGSHGIDGCMSTFLGQSVVTDKLSFLIIGDLSFFYDMNSIRIKHIKNNVRILLLNNRGGAEFQRNHGKSLIPTIDLHTSARHSIVAKGWAESVGFKYLSANSEPEYSSNLKVFMKPSNNPVLFEVFTDMETDSEILKSFISNHTLATEKSKKLVKSILGEENTQKLKRFLKK